MSWGRSIALTLEHDEMQHTPYGHALGKRVIPMERSVMDKARPKGNIEAYHAPSAGWDALTSRYAQIAWDDVFAPVDFEVADTLIIFGHNPAANHPRMLGALREASRRGAVIVSVNALHERDLEHFASPQHSVKTMAFGSTRIASMLIRTKPGGDFALVKAVAKRLIELDDEALANGTERMIDIDFIKQHTLGFSDFAEELREENWPLLEVESGMAREDIEGFARIYAHGKRVVATWCMDITQHTHAVQTVHLLHNLLMMRGNTGRKNTSSSKVCFICSPLPRIAPTLRSCCPAYSNIKGCISDS
ncbi:molybdopterin-dependent oxidoreductase [Paraburkholderia sp. J10-1]|uniref:molybdopterin-dependent oxidoreductase n=1 Tax=Paraburkholderia sp. J10-1 TaxID=2805430 RepID=UPI002AB7D289|nr:molybdopterin-dependent oxidoreductase [Paraburkholderia sp. J10-1]